MKKSHILFFVLLVSLPAWSMPMGSWLFNETSGTTASDSSGYQNDAVLNGLAGWGSNCFTFNGGTFFRIPKGSQGLPFDMSKSFRLSMYINSTQSTGTACLFSRQDGAWVQGCKALYLSNGILNFNCNPVGGVSGKTNVADGQWHQVGMVFDAANGTVLLYVDNIIDGSGNLSAMRTFADTFDGYIGSQGGLFNYAGQMKNVIIDSDILIGVKPQNADFNHDGMVDLTDLLIFGQGWLNGSCDSSNWCEGTALGMGSNVGFQDFSLFASQWLSDPRLRAYLPFDDVTLSDVVGDHSGTVTRSNPVYSSLVPAAIGSGKSLYFNGDDRVDLADTNGLPFSNMPVTWAAWIKTALNGTIIGKGPADGSHVPGDISLFVYNGKLALDIGWVATITGTTAINDNQWHHIAVTADFETSGYKDTVCLYVDGELQASQNIYNVNTYSNSGFATMIGSGGGGYFTGFIDDLRMYNVILNRDDIRRLYAPNSAQLPFPSNGSKDVSVNPTLSWKSGVNATTHNVYFGTSYSAVSVATTASSEFKGTVSQPEFASLSNLNLNTVYYWRIDEVTSGGTVRKGYVWNFTPVYDFQILISNIYYVSTTGSDSNPGTDSQPFATVQRARDQIKADIKRNDTSNKTVMIHGGKYYLNSSLLFTEADSGSVHQLITYQSYPGEQAIIVGGQRVTGWQLDSGSIYKAYVGTNRKFYCLFENGMRGTMARTPNAGYLAIAQAVSSTQFGYNSGDLPASFDYANAQVYTWPGLGNWNWWSITQPITNISFTTKIITITNPTNVNNSTVWNLPAGNRYFVQGAKEFLDAPGEFYLDQSNGYLYYWPINTPIESQEIIAPTTQRLLEVHGSASDRLARNLVFQNICFTVSDFDKSYAFPCPTQGSPEENPQGLIYLENAQNVQIKFCQITNAGFSGVMLNKYAQNNTIYGNIINNIGYHGVYLHGWGTGLGPFENAAQSDTNKNNVISNNCVMNCGLLCGHGSGIYIFQSGNNEISHNYICVMSSRGICIQGEAFPYMPAKYYDTPVTWDNHWDFVHSRNNIISFNDAANCFRDVQDAGVFYCQSMGKYNLLYNNLFHDSVSSVAEAYSHGIYVDDAASYLKVKNNIIYNVNSTANHGSPVFIKGVYNTIVNNIFADSGYDWDTGFWAMGDSPNNHITFAHNIVYKQNGKYIYNFFDWQDDSNRMLESDYNVFYHPGGTYEVYGIPGSDTWSNWKTLFGSKYDQHSSTSNPMFRDRQNNDYTLLPGSPAISLGFAAIDQNSIGLKSDFPCAITLPATGMWLYAQPSGATAYDSTGYGNNGVIVGTPVWDGGGFVFDGATYINIADSSRYRCNGPFTWSAWIKTASSNGIILARDQLDAWTTGAKELYVDSSGKLAFGVGWVGVVTGSTTLTDNQWHHVVVTYQFGTVRLYVDGRLEIVSQLALDSAVDTGFDLRIGIQNMINGSGYGNFTGMIKKVSLFNYALTKTEINNNVIFNF